MPKGEAVGKQAMINALTEMGVSLDDARTAVDLSLHAKNQAMETVKTISDTAPLHLCSLVTALAIDTLGVSLEQEEVIAMQSELLHRGIALAIWTEAAKQRAQN